MTGAWGFLARQLMGCLANAHRVIFLDEWFYKNIFLTAGVYQPLTYSNIEKGLKLRRARAQIRRSVGSADGIFRLAGPCLLICISSLEFGEPVGEWRGKPTSQLSTYHNKILLLQRTRSAAEAATTVARSEQLYFVLGSSPRKPCKQGNYVHILNCKLP